MRCACRGGRPPGPGHGDTELENRTGSRITGSPPLSAIGWLPEAVAHCADQFAAAGIAGQLPEEAAAEALALGVVHLAADGAGRVVAPPVAAALGVGGARDGAGGRALALEHLVVLDALLVGAGRGAGGGAARRALGDAGPAPAVEADAQQQLAARHSLADQFLDGGVGVEALLRDPGVGVQRGVRGRRALRRPGAEEVVGHRVEPVDVLRRTGVVRSVDLAAAARVGGDRRGDQVAGAEARPQRRHQVLERVRTAGVTAQAAGVRVLPVDVDAVEHVRPARVLDEVVAGVGEGARVGGGLPEATRPGPAAERPDHLQAGVQLLQPAQLPEVAPQRTRVPGVRNTVHAGCRIVELVVVGVGVTDGALAVGHVAERIVDMRQLRRTTTRLDVLHVIVAPVDTPLGEVANDLVATSAAAGLRRRGDLVAGTRGVTRGVTRPHGVRVGRRRRQSPVRVRRAGGSRDPGPTTVDVVTGDPDVVGGRRPRQRHTRRRRTRYLKVARRARRSRVTSTATAAGHLDSRDRRVVGPAVHGELDVELAVGNGRGEGAVARGERAAGREDVERAQHRRAFDTYVELALTGGVGPVLDHLQGHLVGAVGDVELVPAPVVEQVVALVQRVVRGAGDAGGRRRGAVQDVVAPSAGAVGLVSRPDLSAAVGDG